MRKPWTHESCKQEALKYSYRSEFSLKSSAYQYACRKGILDEVCSHMERLGNIFNRAIYAIEFCDDSVYVGLTFNLKKRISEHKRESSNPGVRERMGLGVGYSVIYHTTYIPRNEASEKEKSVLEEYRAKGYKILNVAKAGVLGGDTIIWTKEMCHEAASWVSGKNELCEKFPGAYSSAKKNGWLKDMGLEDLPTYRKSGRFCRSEEAPPPPPKIEDFEIKWIRKNGVWVRNGQSWEDAKIEKEREKRQVIRPLPQSKINPRFIRRDGEWIEVT